MCLVSFGLGEGLGGWDVLVLSRSGDSLRRDERLHADYGLQLYGVSSDTLVWLASGLSKQCVKKQCGLVVLCFAWFSTFVSPESVWELQRLDITKL
jgi:hypothetical protein